MAQTLAETGRIVGGLMEKIVREFKPGVKITVLVRTPDHPSRDFCMTDDTMVEVIAMAERRRDAGPDKPTA